MGFTRVVLLAFLATILLGCQDSEVTIVSPSPSNALERSMPSIIDNASKMNPMGFNDVQVSLMASRFTVNDKVPLVIFGPCDKLSGKQYAIEVAISRDKEEILACNLPIPAFRWISGTDCVFEVSSDIRQGPSVLRVLHDGDYEVGVRIVDNSGKFEVCSTVIQIEVYSAEE